MGFFSFLKRKEEPAIPGIEPLKLDLSHPPFETIRPSPSAPITPEVPSFEPHFNMPEPSPSSFMQQKESSSRDIELLSSKLDTIKAMLENIGHRLERLEQQQQQQQKDRARW